MYIGSLDVRAKFPTTSDAINVWIYMLCASAKPQHSGPLLSILQADVRT